MQLMMRSDESSSIGTVTNFDWPTRITEAMMSMAYARSARVQRLYKRGIPPQLEVHSFSACRWRVPSNGGQALLMQKQEQNQ